MNRDEIIRLYEKANGWSPAAYANTVEELERFAALVAAAEREACAKACEAQYKFGLPHGEVYAKLIRKRGQA